MHKRVAALVVCVCVAPLWAQVDVTTSVAAGPPPATLLDPTYQPITPQQRAEWFGTSTVSPTSLLGRGFGAGFSTWSNDPPEYGPHWAGFGKRLGMATTGAATSNLMEASLGMLWGEDPRYFRAGKGPFKSRVGRIFKGTMMSRDKTGTYMPAYARYFAYFGSNYLSNTWRADGDSTGPDAAIRVGLGFLSRASSNAFSEFWPDVKQKVFRKRP